MHGDVWQRLRVLPFLVAGAALAIASTSYEPTSVSRRGRSLEGGWYGLRAIVGAEHPADAAPVWIGRLLLGAAIVAGFVVATRSARARRQS